MFIIQLHIYMKYDLLKLRLFLRRVIEKIEVSL